MPKVKQSEKPRILLVDDEASVAEGIRTALHGDFEIICASSSEEGLHVLAEEPEVRIVVADYKMPGTDGIGFLSVVRQLFPMSVRLLLTGHAQLSMAIDAVNEGRIFRFLTKPCPVSVLKQAINDALEQARLIHADSELLQRKLGELSTALVQTERLAGLGVLAGGVGHELNNILHVYTMLLDMIHGETQRGAPLSPEHLNELRRVRDHLAVHARGLLELGRPSSGASEILEFSAAVLRTLDLLQKVGRSKGVQVRPELASKAVYIRMERVHLEQVVINLVSNAVDAMLSASGGGERVLKVRLDSDGEMAIASFSDNGPGMSAEIRAQIFEPYFTTKKRGRGTGLGLPVVKQLIDSYHGELSVESEIGRGSTFSIRLPICDDAYGERRGD